MTEHPLAIDVETPLGLRVICAAHYWQRIVTIKHPALQGHLADVVASLRDPDEVRRSVRDADVLLFHRRVEPRGCAPS